uniref:Uncharacterized protein n=1 Tax=Bionectria ochroleuca TaxID=29856 RepID=A0A8H7NLI4_BIOOC
MKRSPRSSHPGQSHDSAIRESGQVSIPRAYDEFRSDWALPQLHHGPFCSSFHATKRLSSCTHFTPRGGGGPGRGRYGLGSLTTASNTRDLQHGLNVYWAALSQSSQIRCFVSGRAYSLSPFLLFCDEIDFFASASL